MSQPLLRPAKTKSYDPSPRTTTYEFLGPPGAFFVSTVVPLISLLVARQCTNPAGCPVVQPFAQVSDAPYLADWLAQGKVLGSWTWWAALWDWEGAKWYAAWYTWTVVCWAVLPGEWVQGTELRNGERLWYKINAFATALATIAAGGAAYFLYGLAPFHFVVDHYTGITLAAIVWSVILAFQSYASSFGKERMLALGGNSGNVLYDWFIGRELNPRIGVFDIKTFNELRPGIILWGILDVSYLLTQSSHFPLSTSPYPTDSLILVTAFHLVYVLDALFYERSILTQMDITTDGFGFMLSIGDLLWVPFVYSLQARYLSLVKPVQIGWAGSAAVVALCATGYWIFREANSDKDAFRKGKNPKNLQSMETKRGTRLITSGWWGMSRHPNYFGDWLQALAWCLPTGFSTPMTYLYFGFFVVLLTHRQLRDDEACEKKYGEDWKKYCKIVKSRIVPGVY